MKKILIILILLCVVVGCKNNNEDELKLISTEENYYINKYDYSYDSDKMVTTDVLYAYQFLEDNKCKRIEINGESFYKDDKLYEIPEKITLADKKESIFTMDGFYISNVAECTYKLNEGKISITTKSDKKNKTIKGDYKFNNQKLEVIWESDTSKAVYEKKELDFYVDSYATVDLNINDIYDHYTTSYNFVNNIQNNTINKSMSVDVWAEKTIESYNAEITIDDFLELNNLEPYNTLSNSTTLSDQTWFRETGSIELNIPIEKLDYDGVVTQLSKKNKVPKTSITISNNSGDITLDEVKKNDIATIKYDLNNITNVLKLK